MANYFQTDDRDDYLAQFGSDKPPRAKSLYDITLDGVTLLQSVMGYRGVTFCKTLVAKTRKELGGCWQEELTRLGYTVRKIN